MSYASTWPWLGYGLCIVYSHTMGPTSAASASSQPLQKMDGGLVLDVVGGDRELRIRAAFRVERRLRQAFDEHLILVFSSRQTLLQRDVEDSPPPLVRSS